MLKIELHSLSLSWKKYTNTQTYLESHQIYQAEFLQE